MNNKGFGSAVGLIAILAVALIVLYLTVTQMGAMGFGKSQDSSSRKNPVAAAQEAVDEANRQIRQNAYTIETDE